MSSSEIKSVIVILCKLLNTIFETNLRPEHFRLAKFNKNDENAVPILWDTLKKLLALNKDKADIKSVKQEMKKISYVSFLFYNLPEDYSQGSREILLAICFTVAQDLDKIINKEINNSPFGVNYDLLASVKDDFTTVEIPQPIDRNFIRWIHGKILQNNNMTTEYDVQIKKIMEKLIKSQNIKSTEKLTTAELLALNNKKHCKEFLERSERILEILEIHSQWRKKEKVFWKWMETVLAERSA